MIHPDEEQLIQRVKEADQNAFHQLFDRYYKILFKTIFYRTKNHDLAEDIAQETFFKVWVKRKTLKPKLAFFPLINRISHNLCQDHFKYQQVRVKHHDHVRALVDTPVTNPEQELKRKVLEEKISEVVRGSLANKCATVFLLSRAGGLSNQEIADMLNITKKTVENQLYLALKTIRKKCAKYL